jgi:hypothetical protein
MSDDEKEVRVTTEQVRQWISDEVDLARCDTDAYAKKERKDTYRVTFANTALHVLLERQKLTDLEQMPVLRKDIARLAWLMADSMVEEGPK